MLKVASFGTVYPMDGFDVFGEIVLAENSSAEKGFNEGFKEGCHNGWNAGLAFGFNEGVEIGLEMGLYEGFVTAALNTETLANKSSRVKSTLMGMHELISSFKICSADVDASTIVRNARDKFKQLCSLLKLDKSVIPKSENTF